MSNDLESLTPEALRAEVTRLRGLNATLTSDRDAVAADLREANKESRDRRHELRQLGEQLATLTAERDRYKVSAEADPDGLKKQLDDTRGELRGIRHRQRFDALGKDLGIKDASKLDAAWQLSGYKAEKDDVDDAAVKTVIASTLGKFAWLGDTPGGATPRGTAGAAGSAPNAAGAAPNGAGASASAAAATAGAPGPGADRGVSTSAGGSPKPGKIPGRL